MPYLQMILAALSQSESLSFLVKTMPRVCGGSLGCAPLSPRVERENSLAALTGFLLTCTKLEAPGSTGSKGSPYTLTVVDLPPT